MQQTTFRSCLLINVNVIILETSERRFNHELAFHLHTIKAPLSHNLFNHDAVLSIWEKLFKLNDS